ncbi:hypothetical protein ILUMI_08240 [Ignelater luminosus]|uniref:15-hydroxyprostaglandin dehydrogenase [NAD(+)] n=1 Tax=Ignelater luminosus TaxID=2038154 RepID=A0A8K0D6N0_IGNLU|nr:hypothetical protein ILUMI_08240 [Ignelater luminosus]
MGASLIDIDEKKMQLTVSEIEKQYGKDRVIAVKADVSDREQMEDRCNNGITFSNGITYLPKYKSGFERVIVNTGSVAGLVPLTEGPVYSATKAAVVHFTRSLEMFDIEGKVCLVTGAASGIGYAFVKALLENKAKSVALVDISSDMGQQALNEILQLHGKESAIFIKADVSNKNELEDAFKATVLKFKQLDVVINNAGIFNEKQWEKCISINLNGMIMGTMLAAEKYLPQYKSGEEGIIVNTASAAGLIPFEEGPVYAATKSAIIHFTRSMGGNIRYRETKVRVIAISPGFTDTSLAIVTKDQLNEPYLASFQDEIARGSHQPAQVLADNLMNVIREAPNGSIWLAIKGSLSEMFDIEGKVCLVTGAASGIGYAFAKALLENKAKGVALVDINFDTSQQSLNEILQLHGKESAIFIRADVSNKSELEEAFKATVLKFKQLDVVINNAGILNEKQWEKCISANLNGVVMGTTLAAEKYLPQYKSGEEGIIVNTASPAGLIPFEEGPVYAATKSAIIHFTRSMGGKIRYRETKVRVNAICPGFTTTSMSIVTEEQLNEPYLTSVQNSIARGSHQPAQVLADNLMNVIREAPNGSIWVAVNGSCKKVDFQDFYDKF